MIKALLFDFGSVLSYSLFERHALSEKRLGLAVGSLTWLGPFEPDKDDLWQAMQTQKIGERDYWAFRAKEVGELVGKNWQMPDLLQAVSDPDKLIRPELEAIIHRAKRAGLKVGILSNELELFYGEEILNQLEVLKKMDFIIDATHTHILKPDPRAYQLALEALAVNADQVLFIDDQRRNVTGAEAVGLRAIHFDITQVPKTLHDIDQVLGWM
ncbi:MAG: HAD-IA family hydrolase [Deinococcales bacterium]